MLKAAIDIGSNSVRLLVADVNGDEFKPLFKRINTTRLHEGLSENGFRRTGPAYTRGNRGLCKAGARRGRKRRKYTRIRNQRRARC